MSKFKEHIKIPKEIKEDEKGFFHVLIVEGSFNQVTLEANYTAKKQTYGVKSWLKIKDRLKQVGVQNAYILHDPTIEGESEETGEDTGADAGEDAGVTGEDVGKTKELKPSRADIVEEAKKLGWSGALTASNADFLKFIEDAKALKEKKEEVENK